MPKGNNQKLKLVYLIRILIELTDDEHSITMPEIIDELAKYDISAERKSIYADIEEINKLGIEVIGEKIGKNFYYHVGKKQFELAEIKLLVDAIQSSKFITEKKSSQLIKKLEKNVSKFEAGQLNRQVAVDGRIKNMNESIYYNVDGIHNAIANDRKISFLYYQWNVKKELEVRKDGKRYEISPWSLTWDNENYYLIGFDSESQKMKHYRVDKMKGILTLNEKREGKQAFDEIDLATYTKKRFGMYDGEEVYVKIRFKNNLIGVVIDRFGKDIFIVPDGDDHFIACLNVDVSNQFLGWIFGLGTGAKIISPESVVEKMNNALNDMLSLYH